MTRAFSVFLLLFLSFSSLFSQTLEARLDSLIQTVLTDSVGPGGSFMVARNGKPIYQKAFGQGNLELEVPLTTQSVFQIGSMTKQFTAVAILMLEEEGKLQTQDPISRFIPDYPNGDQITIEHLLTHTSGIRDFTKMKSIQDIAQKQMSPEALLDFFKNEPVDFVPGEKFEYNNSGYVILGYLIEITSGMTFEDFIEQRIFQKLGMSRSYYASDREVIPNRAYGYHLKSTGFVNKTQINFSVPYASGSLMSTLDDLLIWQNALTSKQLLNDNSTEKAFSKKHLSNGEEITYGYGWHLRELAGLPSREHGGSIFGFKSMGVYIPSEDLYVVGLTNCDCNSPTQLTLDLAKLVLTSTMD